MTIYNWSTLADGDEFGVNKPSFNPAVDTLHFDVPSISAADIFIDYFAPDGFTGLSYQDIKSVTLNVSAYKLYSGNVTFADGSVLLFGDQAVTEPGAPGTADDAPQTLSGGSGDDLLVGAGGADSLYGAGGDDVLLELGDKNTGLFGNDTLNGGAGGHDVVDFTGDVNFGIVVNMGNETVNGSITGGDGNPGSTLTLIGIEGVVGTDQNDVFNANSATQINGLRTDIVQTFQGLDGNDTFHGATGDGRVTTLVYVGVDSGVHIDLNAGIASSDGSGGVDTFDNIDAVIGSEHNDVLLGGDTDEFDEIFSYLEGMQGNDVIGHLRAAYDHSPYAIVANIGDDPISGNFYGAGVITVQGGTVRDGWDSLGGGTDSLINEVIDVRGSQFNDTLIGNDDDDNFFEGLGGNDYIDGRGGVGDQGDIVEYFHASGAVYVNLGQGIAYGIGGDNGVGTDTLINIEIARGSDFNDSLVGGGQGEGNWTHAEYFEGRAGNDTLDGGDSNPATIDIAVYIGNPSAAIVNLSSSNVIVDGVTVAGGTARDGFGVNGNPAGTDTLVNINSAIGTQFNDTLVGGSGDNWFDGSDGVDSIVGGAGVDTLVTDSTGDFDFNFLAPGITVNLGAGTATDIWGNTDSISGIENVWGTSRNDTLIGDSQDNLLLGNAGNDRLDGGTGFDTAAYVFAESNMLINLGTGFMSGFDGTDTLISIEGILGGEGNDGITGNTAANRLDGWLGNDVLDGGGSSDTADDTLLGGGGNDTLFQTKGADYLDGGDGTGDRLSFTSTGITYGGTTGVIVDLAAGTSDYNSADTVNGSAYVTRLELIDGTAGADYLKGGDPTHETNGFSSTITEVFRPDGSSSTVPGAADTVEGESALGWTTHVDYSFNNSSQAVTVVLGNSNTIGYAIDGRGFTDTLLNVDGVRGGAGNDVLTGGSYAIQSTGFLIEEFRGGGGNDTINGQGSDTVLGAYGVTDRVSYVASGFAVVANTGTTPISGNFYGTGVIAVGGGRARDGTSSTGGGTDTLISINTLQGSAFNDTLVGGNPKYDFLERFEGREGNDYINGGAGNDEADYSSSANSVIVNLSGSTVLGVASNTASDGFGGTDTLISIERARGGAGDDTLIGGSNALEMLTGHAGDDYIDGGSMTGINYAGFLNAVTGVVAFVENGTGWALDGQQGTDSLHNINGLAGSNTTDTLTGGDGDQWFRGRGGSDLITGGGGTDAVSYASSPNGVVVSLAIGRALNDGWGGVWDLQGTDTISGVENIEGSEFNDSLVGDSGNNLISGLAGNDSIDGGAGADTMIGGSGDDFYVIDNAGDLIVELDGEGNDTVLITTNAAITLPNFVERVKYLGGTGGSVTGNAQDNLFEGDNTNNNFDGAGGTDTASYIYETNAVTINLAAGTATGSGNDTVTAFENAEGGSGSDTIIGTAGANILDGSTGADTLDGGYGADTYYVDSASDVIIDSDTLPGGLMLPGGGGQGSAGLADLIDTVIASINFSLGYLDPVTGTTLLDNLTLTGAATTGTGNALANVLAGNALANTLDAGDGNDTVIGGAGNDSLVGGNGTADWLSFSNSPAGAVVNMFNTGTVVSGSITVQPGQTYDGFGGTDTITGFENVLGSAFNDYLQSATNVANRLEGGSGNDTLAGSGTSDSAGGGVQNDTLYGGAGDDRLRQSRGNDYLDGGDGTDTLEFNGNGITYDSVTGGAVFVDLSAGVSNADGRGTDTVNGVGGDIATVTGIETVLATAGHDTLTGGDPLHAPGIETGQAEIFRPFGGNDTITGHAGNGWSTGVDYSNVSGGATTIVNLGLDPIVVGITTVAGGTALDGQGGTDRLFNVEQVRGGTGNDTLIGGSHEMGIGGNFVEAFRGNAGNDWIDGRGSDTAIGFLAVTDRAEYTNSTFAVVVNLGESNLIGNFYGDSTLETIAGGTARDGFDSLGGGTDTLLYINAIAGSNQNDSLFGGDTNPVERLDGRGGNDWIDGAGGLDEADYSAATGAAIVNLGASAIVSGGTAVGGGRASDGLGGTDTLINIEWARGGDFNDTLIGGANEFERLQGMIGDDYIDGGDTTGVNFAGFSGAAGAVNAFIENGEGTAFDDGQGGEDELHHINGLWGGNYNDSLGGGLGDQWLYGQGGSDTLDGGAGAGDWVTYVLDPQSVIVNLSASTVLGVASNTATDGWGGIWGSQGTDVLLGIENAEGSFNNDTIVGSSGDNVISGFGGNDSLVGGGGTDTLDYSTSESRVVVNMFNSQIIVGADTVNGGQAADGFGGMDTVSGFKNVIGSSFDDYLRGSSNIVNRLDGGEGNDTLQASGTSESVGGGAQNDTVLGNAGDDLIYQTRGNDYFNGGDGFDTLVFSGNGFTNGITYGTGAGAVYVNLGTGTSDADGRETDSVNGAGGDTAFVSGIEYVYGTDGHDTLTGGDPLHAPGFESGQSEYFRPYGGNDTITGHAGNGWGTGVDYSNVSGGATTIVNLGMNPIVVGITTVAGGTALDGQGGTDTLINVDQVRGGFGNDTLIGGSYERGASGTFLETFRGNAGNDWIDGRGGDTLLGVHGLTDRADYSSSSFSVVVNLGSAPLIGNFYGGPVTINGGQARDGTNSGGGGTDTLWHINSVTGSNQSDTLVGGSSEFPSERFEGRGGNDSIVGGSGNDETDYSNATASAIVNLGGGTVVIGTDSVAGFSARDGQSGTDTLVSIEWARGGDFNDTLIGGTATALERLVGGGGNDSLVGGGNLFGETNYAGYVSSGSAVNASIANGAGTALDGLGGTDTLVNINGLWGSYYDDTLTGGSGDQYFRGGGGDDLITGGDNFDTVSYASDPGAVNVNLELGTATDGWGGVFGAQGVDTLSGIDAVEGSDFSDTIIGNSFSNMLDGGRGVDTLVGGDGGDSYWVTSTPTAGTDRIVFARDLVTENAGQGTDTVTTSGSYTLPDNVENLLVVGEVFWRMLVNTGNDLDNQIWAVGTARNRLSGLGGNDTLDGGFGADQLFGDDGNDVLLFDQNDAAIQGGAGEDLLSLFFTSGFTMDLTLLSDSLIQDVEVIDITGNGNNTLKLNLADVLAISSTTDTLRIDGNAGDVVTTDEFNSWAPTGTTTIGSNDYAIYVKSGATLLVDTDITSGSLVN